MKTNPMSAITSEMDAKRVPHFSLLKHTAADKTEQNRTIK